MTVEPEWVHPSPDPASVRRLVEALDCSNVLASVLATRGVTDPDEAAQWLSPSTEAIHDPGGLPDLESAVDRLDSAVTAGESVLVYADRDVDGVTGCAALRPLLSDLGASVDSHVPGKYEGYGLDADILADHTAAGTDLVVAVDCGTTAKDAIDTAVDAGTDVVVVDHHDPDDRLPAATACVNPRRADSSYPNSDLAAGALAWKVGQALLTTHDPVRIESYHQRTLPLAAVATVGDYMPLTLENRAIVREGFDRLPDSGLPGLERTAEHCDVDSLRDLGWSLIPLLNAAQEADSGHVMLDVLLARDRQQVDTLIEQLEDYREDRRQERAERMAHLQACFDSQVDPEDPAYVVRTDDYVGGAAMNDLSQEWYRPVFTYRRKNDRYKGGARSAPAVDLLEVLASCEDLLDDYWGHPGAAGFEMDLNEPAPFEQRVTEVITNNYDVEAFRPTLDIDAVLEPNALHVGNVEEIEALAPFGTDHDEPLVLVEGVEFDEFDQFGNGDDHWKGHPVEGEFEVLDWGGETLPAVEAGRAYDVAGSLSEDGWSGGVILDVEGVSHPSDDPRW
jgi:single-stranded-DNA-specific exonuclease